MQQKNLAGPKQTKKTNKLSLPIRYCNLMVAVVSETAFVARWCFTQANSLYTSDNQSKGASERSRREWAEF